MSMEIICNKCHKLSYPFADFVETDCNGDDVTVLASECCEEPLTDEQIEILEDICNG